MQTQITKEDYWMRDFGLIFFGSINKKPSLIKDNFNTKSDKTWVKTTEFQRRNFRSDVMKIIKDQLTIDQKSQYEDLYQLVLNNGYETRPDGTSFTKSRCDKYVISAKLELGIAISQQKSRATPTTREIIRLYKLGKKTNEICKAVGKDHRYCTAIRSYATNRGLI